MSTAAALHLRPLPSRALAIGVVALHGATLGLIFVLPLGGLPQLLLALLTLASLALASRQPITSHGPGAIRSLLWRPDGVWEIEDRNGHLREARLLSSARLGPRLVILRFDAGRWPHPTLILTPACIDPEDLRRLRVRLGTADHDAHRPDPR